MKQERANYGYQYFNQFASSKGDDPVSTVTAGKILDIYRSWIGYSEANGKHKKIVDLYNSHKPLARGYAVKYSDSWCDTCLSAAFIKAGAVTLIGGTECGVEEHIKIFKKSGIWIEDGTITPKMGDIIVYNWDQKTQPNDGYADHIGIVESVSGNMITTIEGNYKDAVGRRVIPVGWGYIRGYARPRYAAEAQQKVYHVQAATYTDRKYADQLVLKLKSYGIDSYSYQKSGYWLVQAGAYASKANADAMLKRLQDLGISGMIWK
ncbi:CHAP domain-containing protein [Lachnospiraceae bacterium Oil+RF-744-WCA-WT-11]|uniref:CHAP domain-containing protein n=2 Tax=Porcincola intestinalis TaxID=2606632 RepID=A0A6L5X317_9FIRM|nr:CHAP domain-containing protein [Porcincola intestinalis]